MKRFIAIITLLTVCCTVWAQNYIVVDSEKIFKSVDEYNKALTTLDNLSRDYQSKVDEKYKDIETLYNTYIAQKAQLSAAQRNAYEQEILSREKSAQEYQESVFGDNGTVMKKRIELIQPIQKKVFAAIEKYAQANGCAMVIDIASNATVLYHSSAVDHTDRIIEELKK